MKNNMDIKKNNTEENNNQKRTIIYIIIIIIIILSLLSSCSCTSKFFGKIGDIFKNEDTYPIDKDGNYNETIRNKDLKFDTEYLEISLSDNEAKISFTYTNIVPEGFTCVTSDAEIATCYVVDNHVVIIPKKAGIVDITLQTKANNRNYEATAKVKINDIARYIELSSKSGTINLAKSNEIRVAYTLVGLSGDVIATSSDPKVAKVKVENGKLIITGLKKGKSTIELSLNYNGITYTNSYILTVIHNSHSSVGKNTNNLLKDLKVSEGTLTPKFDSKKNNYTVTVDYEIDTITLNAIASSNKATITYNGQKSGEDIKLKVGDNNVVIKVTAEDGSVRTYTVNVIRKKSDKTDKDTNNNLTDIKLSTGTLIPSFDKNTTSYSVTVDSSTDKISVTGIPESDKSTITYNGAILDSLKDFKLNYGENVIVIKVTAEDGSTKDYVITVNRSSKYTIMLDNSAYNFNLYGENPEFYVNYKVYKNGEITEDYELKDIETLLEPDHSKDLKITKLEKGLLVLNPNSSTIGNIIDKTINLTIKYKGDKDTTKLTFSNFKYSLTSELDKYDMDVSSNEIGEIIGTRDIILRTDLFSDKVKVTTSKDHKTLNICSTSKNACVTIKTDSDLISKIEYTGEANGPTSLPIKITASGDGLATLNVTGTIFGKTFKELNIDLNIIRKYIVTLNANKGVFNMGTTTYQFKVASTDEIDLSTVEVPYKLNPDNECEYFEFEGYSKKATGAVLYEKDDIIKNITEDIELYAIYKTISIPVTDDLTKQTLWLTDVPLFHNEEYYQQHGEDKVIYPGASGYYIMNFKNETPKEITLTGMVLKEETICIDNDNCLNMGYIVQYRPVDKDNASYYYGSENNYQILNKDVNPNILGYQGKDIQFADEITLKPGEETSISLFWRWVEIDSKSDIVDTKIGNIAANSKYDETINDKYKLSVGLQFRNRGDPCTKSDTS